MRTPSARGSAPPDSPVPEPRATNGTPACVAGPDDRLHARRVLGQHGERRGHLVLRQPVALVGAQPRVVVDDRVRSPSFARSVRASSAMTGLRSGRGWSGACVSVSRGPPRGRAVTAYASRS